MGPEGGDGGGAIVAQGTPEQIAADGASHTGRFLREVLARRPIAHRAGEGAQGGKATKGRAKVTGAGVRQAAE